MVHSPTKNDIFSILSLLLSSFLQTEVANYIPENVEDRIRHAALAKRVRTTEFFKDFDKLRTGYITSKLYGIHEYTDSDRCAVTVCNNCMLYI